MNILDEFNETDGNKIAIDLLDKCGFLENILNIANDVEQEIASSYEAEEAEEDEGGTETYGGLVYTRYLLVNNGKIQHRIRRNLSDEKAKVLTWLSDEGSLEVSVCRNDYFKHEYSFTLYLPSSANSAPTHDAFVDISLKLSFNTGRVDSFVADLSEGLDAKAIEKSLMLCVLSS